MIAAQVLSERTGRLAAQLMGYSGTRVLQDNCLWKPPGARSLGMHQDGSFADYLVPAEMITCWVALDDTRAEGGTIEYAPRLSPLAQGAAGPGQLPRPRRLARADARRDPRGRGARAACPVVVKAGGCSFHHSLTFHGSGPNEATRERRALVSHLVPVQTRFHPVERRPDLLALPPPRRPLAGRVVLPGAVGRDRRPQRLARPAAGRRERLRPSVSDSTAPMHGPRWSARAVDWAELSSPSSRPAWEAVAAATEIGAGTRVLDVGCGSGEFCRLAADRGATVSGIDAAEGMIEIARRRTPDADLRVGGMELLPWDDDSFDVTTGFNSFQFAADVVAALVDAKRVTRPGGCVAICHWGRPEDNELFAVIGAVRELQPPPPPGSPPPGPPTLGEPGALEEVAERAGLRPLRSEEIDLLFEAPDRQKLERAMLAPGAILPAIEYSGEERVRAAVTEAAAPFRQADGSYRFANRFRFLIAAA